MEQVQGRAFRQFGVLAIVVGGHMLLVLLLSSSRPSDMRKGIPGTEPRTTLVLLDLEPRAQESPAKQTPRTPPTPNASRKRTERPRKTSGEVPGKNNSGASESTASVAPDQSGGVPAIDWQLEMETTARSMGPRMLKELQRRCEAAERVRAPRPPGCGRRSFDEPWRPSGDIARDMRDPDRPRSSVPDALPPAFPTAPRPQVFKDEE
jgi:hypothetical protein